MYNSSNIVKFQNEININNIISPISGNMLSMKFKEMSKYNLQESLAEKKV